jgi:hypothetical protein
MTCPAEQASLYNTVLQHLQLLNTFNSSTTSLLQQLQHFNNFNTLDSSSILSIVANPVMRYAMDTQEIQKKVDDIVQNAAGFVSSHDKPLESKLRNILLGLP